MDPIHQFDVTKYLTFGTIGGAEFAFTKSALFMLISVALVALLMIGATGSRAIVPGRLQSLAELSYEFVADTLQATTGAEGMRFFPFVFTLFMFILAVNVIGLVPYMFAVTAQIIITVRWRSGVLDRDRLRHLEEWRHFFKLFVPSGSRSISCRW